MNKPSHLPLVALGFLLPLVSACSRPGAPATPSSAASADGGPQTVLGKTVDGAMRKVRQELETRNLDVGDVTRMVSGGRDSGNAAGAGKAQITPTGDLLIGGKPVSVTPRQRAMLLDYRKQVIAVAETGMALGVKGADLAGTAVLDTFSGLMQGNVDEAGKRIDAAGQRIAAQARQICMQLPALLDSQQQLAASLPAFKPYATMTRADLADCRKGAGAAVTSN